MSLNPDRHVALSRIQSKRRRAGTTVLYTLLLLILRGGVLWIVVPLTVLVWVFALPIRVVRRLMGRRHATLRQYLSWADGTLVAVLERSVLRPFGMQQPFPRWPRPGDETKGGTLLDAW